MLKQYLSNRRGLFFGFRNVSMLDMTQRSLMMLGLIMLAGCGTEADQNTAEAPNAPASMTQEIAAAEDDHSGWWCVEHGIPEEVCTRCDASLIADFKSKDDWCDEHDRPHSQCFLCQPELEAQFAARYEAKYGEQPPKPTDP